MKLDYICDSQILQEKYENENNEKIKISGQTGINLTELISMKTKLIFIFLSFVNHEIYVNFLFVVKKHQGMFNENENYITKL